MLPLARGVSFHSVGHPAPARPHPTTGTQRSIIGKTSNTQKCLSHSKRSITVTKASGTKLVEPAMGMSTQFDVFYFEKN